MKKLNKLITLSLFSCLFATAIAQDSTQTFQFTLKQAQDYAVLNSYQTRSATLDVEKSEKKVWETTAIGLPQISASAGYTYNIKLPVQLVPGDAFPGGQPGTFQELTFGTEQSMSAAINVNQLIFDGSYIVGLQAAKVYKEISINDQAKSAIEIKDIVTQAYGGVLVAERNKSILKENLSNIDKIVSDNKALYENGFVAEQDYDQLQLLRSQTKSAYDNAERQVQISKNLLKFSMGIEIANTIELTESLDEIVNEVDAEGLASSTFNIESHIDYRIIENQEKASLLLVKQEKSAFLPRLSATYSFQENSFSNEFNFFSDAPWFNAQYVGLNLSVPIFSSGMRLAKVKQAQLDFEKVTLAKKQVSENLKMGLITSRSDYTYALDQYNSQKANMELANRIFTKEQIKYQEGISSSLELTQANNQLLSTQGDYLNSILQLISAKSKLDKALNNY
ncbi:TolC family protein [bacterium]|nr:TolC family protein [bacterium]